MPAGLQVFRADGSIKIDISTQLTRVTGTKLLTDADMYGLPSDAGPAYRKYYQSFTMPTVPSNLGQSWYTTTITRGTGEMTSSDAPIMSVSGRTIQIYYGDSPSRPDSRDVLIQWGAY